MVEQPTDQRRWWKEAVVYQIYPRSFMDSNGDGIGDLPGILSRLDHLQALGVNVVWLGPHFDSPGADNGYDIRGYRQVLAAFGTMADFDRLLEGLKARGMRLILDLVVNHTSDEHPWFVSSKAGPNSPKRDFYIWCEDRRGGPPNNWPAIFGGSAWSQDKVSGQYVLNTFTPRQPDLNWETPALRAEVYDLMRFWLDKGVSGFRMDVIAFISKPADFTDMTPEALAHPERVYAGGPRLHAFLREMKREVLDRYDLMTVGEAFGLSSEQVEALTDGRTGELNMAIDFALVDLPPGAFSLPQFKEILARKDRLAGEHGWNAAFLGNHDQPRAVSHFGDDDPAWRAASSKALATVLLTQRATPFIYQGEEIGMANAPWSGIEEFDDVWAKTYWREQVETGRVPAEEALARLRRTGRDNARTPMQWSAAANGGFTTGKPWLKINPDFAEVNVEAQAGRGDSVLAHYRRLIALRRAEPALVYGAYTDIDPEHPAVFAYTRRLADKAFLVLANFSRAPVDYALPPDVAPKVAALPDVSGSLISGPAVRLEGWGSAIFEIEG